MSADRVTLDMNAGEALFALDAVTRAGTEAHKTRRFLLVTHAPSDEQAIADMSAAAFDRLELRLRNLLFPEPRCQYMDNADCDHSPIEGSRYCRLHDNAMAGIYPTFRA
jgi:hypothetical protein